jgi:hypothetical protein
VKRPAFREHASAPEYVIAGGHRLRLLTAADVHCQISTEADETQFVEGHFATDEPELDRENEREIIERLQQGDDSAWCGVIVEATWTSAEERVDSRERIYTGRASLWGCTLSHEYTEETVAKEHGLYEQAIDDLNEQLARAVEHAASLARQLKPKRKR